MDPIVSRARVFSLDRDPAIFRVNGGCSPDLFNLAYN